MNRFHRLVLLALAVSLPMETTAWIAPSPTQSTRTSRFSSKSTRLSVSGTAVVTLDGKEIRGPITPMGNAIFVKVKDTLTATSGGILLPDQAKERPTEGVVVASGPGKLHPFTGVRITNPVPENSSVVYGKFDGRPVEYNGDECQMIYDDNVLLYYTGVTLKFESATPVRDWVLIALENDKFGNGNDAAGAPMQTSSGVVIAAQVMKDAVPCQGVVAKVGEGRMAANGNLTPSPVKPGDVVKFKDYAGNDIMIEGKPYSVVKMVDILCTIQEESVTQEESSADE